MLSINIVARIVNLSIDTIRAWEKRYRAVVPQRAQGGRRVFSSRDIERLILLREIVATGAPISRVAGCTTSELRGMIRAASDLGESDDAEVVRILKIIAAHDTLALCDALLTAALIRGASEFADDIIAAVLSELERDVDAHRTGELLLASALLSISATLFGKYRIGNGPSFVSLTLPGEQHAIPPLFAALVACEAGYSGFYAGNQIEPVDIETLLQDLDAAAVAIYAGVDSYENVQAIHRMQNKLPRVRFIFMGRSGGLAPHDQLSVTSFRELESELRRTAATPVVS